MTEDNVPTSRRVREAGLFLLRVTSLGAVALLVKDRRVREVALNHIAELGKQLLD